MAIVSTIVAIGDNAGQTDIHVRDDPPEIVYFRLLSRKLFMHRP